MAKIESWSNLKEGDLFGIFLDDKRFFVGQIVLTEEYSFHMVVYDCICSYVEEIDNAIQSASVIFFGDTDDSEFYKNHWKRFHNAPYDNNFPRPYNVIYTKPPPDALMVLRDFDGNYVRDASTDDLEHYRGRLSVDPGMFTTGVKVFVKEGWEHDYGSIDIRRILERCKLSG